MTIKIEAESIMSSSFHDSYCKIHIRVGGVFVSLPPIKGVERETIAEQLVLVIESLCPHPTMNRKNEWISDRFQIMGINLKEVA